MPKTFSMQSSQYGAGGWKIFHFQELDWLICFPNGENQGRKYLYYTVGFADRKTTKVPRQINLSEVVDQPAFENSFPHTIGYFRSAVCNGELPDCYLELRVLRCLEDFWKFLNDLNI
ncbi:MAG: hypothetical protein NWE98_02415 [Candidatus Bathyarchaeota archaeon]|nr:hypothetical protein [Candidatus Bathyarchaeota archaeon]